MPLTRHLYQEAGVHDALRVAILEKRPVEAIFWCQELLDSNLIDDCMATLRLVWLEFAVNALGLARCFQEIEADPGPVLQLVSTLCQLEKSVMNPVEKQKGGEKAALKAIMDDQDARGIVLGVRKPDAFLQMAAMKKHGVEACKLLAILDGDDEERRMIGTAALCLSAQAFTASWNQTLGPIHTEALKELRGWRKLTSRRARRIYSCPQPGGMIGSIEPHIRGSYFWEGAVEPYGGWDALQNEVREAFYEKYFRDDIPDEWSKQERAKSHA